MKAARPVLLDDEFQGFFTRSFSLPAGSGVMSKRRLRLYSASLPKRLKSDDGERIFLVGFFIEWNSR